MQSGGGLQALVYSYRKARESGGVLRFWRRMRQRNACKTCALGMSGMHNEAGSALEVCKKSFQAQAADMQPPISEEFFRQHALADLLRWDHKDLEDAGRIGFPLVLEPGDSWAGTISAGGSLVASSWVRVVFGALVAVGTPPEGLDDQVVWITDNVHRLRR